MIVPREQGHGCPFVTVNCVIVHVQLNHASQLLNILFPAVVVDYNSDFPMCFLNFCMFFEQ